MPALTKDRIDQLVQTYFEGLLSKADELAVLLPDDPSIDLNHEIEGMREDQADLRKCIVEREYDGATIHDAQELLKESGHEKHGLNSDEFDAICNGILRAKVEQRRILMAMLLGEYENTEPIDPLLKGIKSPGLPPLPGEKSTGASFTISAAKEKYCTFKKAYDWVPKTYDENVRVLSWFEDFVGKGRSIKSVSVEDVRDFRDTLISLPANFTKSKKFAGKSLREISDIAADEKKLSAGTTKKYFGCVRWFLGWCEEEGYIEKNPAQKIKITTKIDAQDAKHPFSKDQLIRLFKSPQYTGHRSLARRSSPGKMIVRDGKFWVPLVGLFTGMRLGEIVQLLVTDIQNQDGVDYFDVTKGEDTGKTLKTASSRRVIPIHPELEKMGFLEYVKSQREKNSKGRIFAEIKRGANGYYSHNFSKYFGRYLKQVRVKTSKTTFHSFRHSFTDALVAASVEDSRIMALLGHSNKSVTGIYISEIPVKALATDIAKVSYGIEWDHLWEN